MEVESTITYRIELERHMLDILAPILLDNVVKQKNINANPILNTPRAQTKKNLLI